MSEHDPAKHLASWGRQTIAFALSLKAQDDGQALDDPAQVLHARNATEKIASELWSEAAHESQRDSDIFMRFARKVLDWVADHRSDEKAP